MIDEAQGSGAASDETRRELGEWVRPSRVRQHPTRPEATPDRHSRPEGALALMMPEHGPAWSSNDPAPRVAAIETSYKGCRFRSRLEARWAVFFDSLGIRWEYEPQGFVVNGRPYLPDFKLILPDDRIVFAEVKNDEVDEYQGEHVQLCRALADGTGHPVVLLAGIPAHRMYHQFTPNLKADSFTAAFFCDYGARPFTADAYWFQSVRPNSHTGVLEFIHDERGLRKSFGQGLVNAVRAARSARFEHGESGAS